MATWWLLSTYHATYSSSENDNTCQTGWSTKMMSLKNDFVSPDADKANKVLFHAFHKLTTGKQYKSKTHDYSDRILIFTTEKQSVITLLEGNVGITVGMNTCWPVSSHTLIRNIGASAQQGCSCHGFRTTWGILGKVINTGGGACWGHLPARSS